MLKCVAANFVIMLDQVKNIGIDKIQSGRASTTTQCARNIKGPPVSVSFQYFSSRSKTRFQTVIEGKRDEPSRVPYGKGMPCQTRVCQIAQRPRYSFYAPVHFVGSSRRNRFLWVSPDRDFTMRQSERILIYPIWLTRSFQKNCDLSASGLYRLAPNRISPIARVPHFGLFWAVRSRFEIPLPFIKNRKLPPLRRDPK